MNQARARRRLRRRALRRWVRQHNGRQRLDNLGCACGACTRLGGPVLLLPSVDGGHFDLHELLGSLHWWTAPGADLVYTQPVEPDSIRYRREARAQYLADVERMRRGAAGA